MQLLMSKILEYVIHLPLVSSFTFTSHLKLKWPFETEIFMQITPKCSILFLHRCVIVTVRLCLNCLLNSIKVISLLSYLTKLG